MIPVEHALPIACAASAVLWAVAAAARSRHGVGQLAARGLLGGLAAVFLASAAYDLAAAAGAALSWDALADGGHRSLRIGLAIGAVEESAKVLGLLLVVRAGWRRRETAAAAVGVAAGFAALEAALALHGAALGHAVVARVALAPVAHALLFVPAAAAVAVGLRHGGRGWWWLAPGLAASALLHAAGDLSLALPGPGRLGYAASLLAPLLAVYAVTAVRGRSPRASARGGVGPVSAAGAAR
jgi:RsiW-degrading membrane proteinase PrsW (M82 family)